MFFIDFCCLFENIHFTLVKAYFLRHWTPQGDRKDPPRAQLAPPSGAQGAPRTPIYDKGTPGTPTGTRIGHQKEPKSMKRGAHGANKRETIGPAGCAKRKQFQNVKI